jgi:hypothetical protein
MADLDPCSLSRLPPLVMAVFFAAFGLRAGSSLSLHPSGL